jgi:hypothetical protein
MLTIAVDGLIYHQKPPLPGTGPVTVEPQSLSFTSSNRAAAVKGHLFLDTRFRIISPTPSPANKFSI